MFAPLRPLTVSALLFLAFAATASAQPADAQARLWDAAIAGDTTNIVAALAEGADVNALDTRRSRNGRRALNWAALNDRVPAIRVLLANGAELEGRNLTGFTALHHAAESGSMNAARALLDAGADPAAANRAGVLPAATARNLGHIGLALVLDAAAASDDD